MDFATSAAYLGLAPGQTNQSAAHLGLWPAVFTEVDPPVDREPKSYSLSSFSSYFPREAEVGREDRSNRKIAVDDDEVLLLHLI